VRVREDAWVRVFHIALASDWDAARQEGRYTMSTLGRTLAEEGFIHASRGDQWQRVRDAAYADVTEPLVLLTIDTDKLDAPVVDEPVPGSDETFPHVYGALEVDAVVSVIPLEPRTEPKDEPRQQGPTFSKLFLDEVLFRALLGFAVFVVAGAVGGICRAAWGPTAALVGALVTLAVGGVVAVRVARRRDERLRPAS
jgi:uncharacterized protein (DUF952 family)